MNLNLFVSANCLTGDLEKLKSLVHSVEGSAGGDSVSAGENIHENGTHENGVVQSVDQTTPTPIHYLLNVCAFTFLSCSKFIIFLNTLQYIRSTFVIS